MGGKARSLTKIAASSATPPQSTGLFSPNYIQRNILKCLLLSVILQKNQVYNWSKSHTAFNLCTVYDQS